MNLDNDLLVLHKKASLDNFAITRSSNKNGCRVPAPETSGFYGRGEKGGKVGQVLVDKVRRGLLGRDGMNYETDETGKQ